MHSTVSSEEEVLLLVLKEVSRQNIKLFAAVFNNAENILLRTTVEVL